MGKGWCHGTKPLEEAEMTKTRGRAVTYGTENSDTIGKTGKEIWKSRVGGLRMLFIVPWRFLGSAFPTGSSTIDTFAPPTITARGACLCHYLHAFGFRQQDTMTSLHDERRLQHLALRQINLLLAELYIFLFLLSLWPHNLNSRPNSQSRGMNALTKFFNGSLLEAFEYSIYACGFDFCERKSLSVPECMGDMIDSASSRPISTFPSIKVVCRTWTKSRWQYKTRRGGLILFSSSCPSFPLHEISLLCIFEAVLAEQVGAGLCFRPLAMFWLRFQAENSMSLRGFPTSTRSRCTCIQIDHNPREGSMIKILSNYYHIWSDSIGFNPRVEVVEEICLDAEDKSVSSKEGLTSPPPTSHQVRVELVFIAGPVHTIE
ncbi:uncharacterized protein BDR25DRAFT_361121 [Lindgomyces ingoldianus]|uniref:Uncharacterized protein n=1 Tax=Lindgomyces ingoldianus TaxID=673940 RepID=A0ACB6QCY9_9PLEO|nr:uncharacterized protein BDR25DRAFT_361121 [Lindgomyces ingoldianus]KAF2464894.1 hypothetical protein BDR25DRAFT_361121 [Lindgomyces ingoldianus]